MQGLIGRPVLLDAMDAELVPKVVQAIIDDNERARKAKRERRERKRNERDAKRRPADEA